MWLLLQSHPLLHQDSHTFFFYVVGDSRGPPQPTAYFTPPPGAILSTKAPRKTVHVWIPVRKTKGKEGEGATKRERRDETRRNAYSRCPRRGHNISLQNTTPCTPRTPLPVTTQQRGLFLLRQRGNISRDLSRHLKILAGLSRADVDSGFTSWCCTVASAIAWEVTEGRRRERPREKEGEGATKREKMEEVIGYLSPLKFEDARDLSLCGTSAF